MQNKKKDRLGELCDRALAETDPQELVALFGEINHILWQHILEVDNVIRRQRERGVSLESPYMM